MIQLYTIKNGVDKLIKEFNNKEEADSYIKSCELSLRRKQMAKKEGRRIYNKRTPLFDCDEHYLKDTKNKEQDSFYKIKVILGNSLSGTASNAFIQGDASLLIFPDKDIKLSQYQHNSIFARGSIAEKNKILDYYDYKMKSTTYDVTIKKVFPIQDIAGFYIQDIILNIPVNIDNTCKEVSEKVYENIEKHVNTPEPPEPSKYQKIKFFVVLGIKILGRFVTLCYKHRKEFFNIIKQ